MIFFWILLTIVVLQRLVELILAKRNESILKAKGALEFDKNGYRAIFVMHIAFFISLLSEKFLLHRELNKFWIFFLALFLIAQFIRYWAITTLGIN